MKYLRSLMQQSVTACKNQAKLIQQFTLSLLYLLIIHIVALLFFFLFRLVLFTSIDYQFPPDIQNNFLMQATAFIKGLCMGHRTKRFFQWSGKMGERF